MGSGKTEVGKILAKRLGLPFVDMDEEIERSEGLSIPEIFSRKGEEYFRKRETEILKKIAENSGCVVSTGGGVVTREENWEILRKGITIYLSLTEEEACRRLKGVNNRPLLEGGKREERISFLLRRRLPLYEKADFKVETTGRSIEEVVKEIIQLLGRDART